MKTVYAKSERAVTRFISTKITSDRILVFNASFIYMALTRLKILS